MLNNVFKKTDKEKAFPTYFEKPDNFLCKDFFVCYGEYPFYTPLIPEVLHVK